MRTDERPESGAGKSLKAWVRALEATAAIERGQAPILPLLFTELAARFGTAPALITKNETLTFTELNATVTRYARWGLTQGWRAGDVVCLLMPNCLHYMPIWLGLTRIGVVVSLLNSNLTDAPLAHAVRVITPRSLIVSPELCAPVRSISAHLPHSLSLWADGANDSAVPRLDLAMAEMAAEPLTDTECPPPGLNDRALYIYTSGTTGLPKAANVSHRRLMQWSHWFAGLMDTGPTDRMYNCLPLYHSIGGVVATGATLVRGGAVVLRERFSARDFWQDVVQQRCTLFQYIGELCRYLLATAPQPEETAAVLRQRAARRRLAAVSAAVPHPSDPRVLRGDGGKLLAIQLRGTYRRHRKDSALPVAPDACRTDPARYGARATGARRSGAVYQVRTG
jgi:fatty-acyl-CoA synthase